MRGPFQTLRKTLLHFGGDDEGEHLCQANQRQHVLQHRCCTLKLSLASIETILRRSNKCLFCFLAVPSVAQSSLGTFVVFAAHWCHKTDVKSLSCLFTVWAEVACALLKVLRIAFPWLPSLSCLPSLSPWPNELGSFLTDALFAGGSKKVGYMLYCTRYCLWIESLECKT